MENIKEIIVNQSIAELEVSKRRTKKINSLKESIRTRELLYEMEKQELEELEELEELKNLDGNGTEWCSIRQIVQFCHKISKESPDALRELSLLLQENEDAWLMESEFSHRF